MSFLNLQFFSSFQQPMYTCINMQIVTFLDNIWVNFIVQSCTTCYHWWYKNNVSQIKVSLWPKIFFGFCISRMHKRVFQKKNFNSVTFSPQNWTLKFPCRPCLTKMTQSCKVWVVQNRPWRHFRSSLLSPPVYFNISLYFQTNSFFGLFVPKNDWFCMQKQWNTEMKSQWSLIEVMSWPVLDPDLATPGHFCLAWLAREL